MEQKRLKKYSPDDLVLIAQDSAHVDQIIKDQKGKQKNPNHNLPWYYKRVQHVPTVHFYAFKANDINKLDEFAPKLVDEFTRYKLIEKIEDVLDELQLMTD